MVKPKYFRRKIGWRLLLLLFLSLGIWYFFWLPYGKIPGRKISKRCFQVSVFNNKICGPFLDNDQFVIALRFPFYREGVIDSVGNIIVPLKYDNVSILSGGYKVKKGDYYGWLDTLGNTLIPIKYKGLKRINKNELYDHTTFLVQVEKNGKSLIGMLDSAGNEIIPIRYGGWYDNGDYAAFIPDSVIVNKPVVYDFKGNTIIDSIYNFVALPSRHQSFFTARTDNPHKQFIIDEKTLQTREVNFAINRSYTLESSGVTIGSALYTDSITTTIPWSDANMVYNDENIILPNGKIYNTYKGLLDKKGNIVLPFIYDAITPIADENYFVVERNGYKGLYHIASQKWIIPIKYKDVHTHSFETLPLFWYENNNDEIFYTDPYGTVILSSKARIAEVKKDHILFQKNNNLYRLQYDKAKQQFTWQRELLIKKQS